MRAFPSGRTVRSLALFILLVSAAGRAAETPRAGVVERPPGGRTNSFYVANRPPLEPSPFCKLPIGAITPHGWLRHMLELEAEGMTGHLAEVSPWCRAEGNAWLNPGDENAHSPWEELPYWLKGIGDLGYVLGNPRVIGEARKWLEAIISNQQSDGWFGPVSNKRRIKGKPDLGPNMLALNALQSYYEFSGDRRVLEVMTKYFHWMMNLPESDFLLGTYDIPQNRGGDLIESAYWLYNRTGDAFLLDLGGRIHARARKWCEGNICGHGVNFSQGFREPAVYWMQARDAKFLMATYQNYDKFMGEFGQQPGGLFASDECARPGYTDPRQAAETCAIVEYMHSFEMLTKITGEPLWADRCEELAFNSLPASQPPDLKGLHYLTAANQPRLDILDHSPGIANGGEQFAYDPFGYRCCQHNVGMGWPYYAEELWLATPDNGLCLSLYASSQVAARVGDGTAVKITEKTDYPFGESVTLSFCIPHSVRFPLYLRVPRWCKTPSMILNGRALITQAKPLSYMVVEKKWADGDQLVVCFPMQLAVRVWESNRKAVSIDRGPLTFSLKIGEEWKRCGGNDKWPAWEVLPATPWNYGLELDPARPENSIAVIRKSAPLAQQPFTPQAAPIELRAKARRIPAWGFDRHGLCAVLQASPAYTAEPLETVALIPMGCARLRIAVLPLATPDQRANRWQPETDQGGEARK